MKRLRVILLFLLLGGIVNVAVAWGFVLVWGLSWGSKPKLSDRTNFGESSASGRFWAVSFGQSTGRAWLARVAQSDQTRKTRNNPRMTVITDQLLYWSRSTTLPTAEETFPEYPERMISEWAFGWPLLSCVYEVHSVRYYREGKPAVFKRLSGGLPIPLMKSPTLTPNMSPTWVKAYALPYKPLLHGLFINTFFYAVVLWLLIPGPFVLRRFIRRKRGFCLKCAYDLRGAEHEACPECGVEVATPSPN